MLQDGDYHAICYKNCSSAHPSSSSSVSSSFMSHSLFSSSSPTPSRSQKPPAKIPSPRRRLPAQSSQHICRISNTLQYSVMLCQTADERQQKWQPIEHKVDRDADQPLATRTAHCCRDAHSRASDGPSTERRLHVRDSKTCHPTPAAHSYCATGTSSARSSSGATCAGRRPSCCSTRGSPPTSLPSLPEVHWACPRTAMATRKSMPAA